MAHPPKTIENIMISFAGESLPVYNFVFSLCPYILLSSCKTAGKKSIILL